MTRTAVVLLLRSYAARADWLRLRIPGRIDPSMTRTRRNDMAKYGKKAQSKVKKAMEERKAGTLRSGRSGKKVTSRKQAIAIGLSEARRAGGKAPPNPSRSKKSSAKKSSKKSAPRKSAKKSATKKSSSKKKSASKRSGTKKSSARKSSSKRSSAKKSTSKNKAAKKSRSRKSSSKKSKKS